MAFGFGFNKQKALNAAEKYVQQARCKTPSLSTKRSSRPIPKTSPSQHDRRPLLPPRRCRQSTDCFKTVGDAYATQGFTVKAIAMYKKISKLKPSLESVLKLAELYTQQGLFNDAAPNTCR